MKLPHPIRYRRERRIAEITTTARVFGEALNMVLNSARPKVEYIVRHAPRPQPNQMQIRGKLRDGQPVYLDAIALNGQRIAIIPMREWLVGGDNPLDLLEITFDYLH